MFNNTQRTEAKRNTGCRNKVRGQRHIRQLLGATAESLASVLLSLYVGFSFTVSIRLPFDRASFI